MYPPRPPELRVVNKIDPPAGGSPGERPMGDVPVIVRLVLEDGSEMWRPARANRWRGGGVLVIWENVIGNGWSSQFDWLAVEDVTRAITGPSHQLTPRWHELPRWGTTP